MKNPFVYGATVTGDDFANREKEIKELVQDLKDGERVFLISPRKYGDYSPRLKSGASTDWIPRDCSPSLRIFKDAL